jgi:hypothetical protein
MKEKLGWLQRGAEAAPDVGEYAGLPAGERAPCGSSRLEAQSVGHLLSWPAQLSEKRAVWTVRVPNETEPLRLFFWLFLSFDFNRT